MSDNAAVKSGERTPDDDVLLELGRLTWEAINLEDEADGLCQLLAPSGGPPHSEAIGARITEGRKAAAAIADQSVRGRVDAWLETAGSALVQRNAVLHAMPVSFEPLPGTTPIPGAPMDLLSHWPRKGTPSVVHTDITTDGLRQVRTRLTKARDGYIDVAREVAEVLYGARPGSA